MENRSSVISARPVLELESDGLPSVEAFLASPPLSSPGGDRLFDLLVGSSSSDIRHSTSSQPEVSGALAPRHDMERSPTPRSARSPDKVRSGSPVPASPGASAALIASVASPFRRQRLGCQFRWPIGAPDSQQAEHDQLVVGQAGSSACDVVDDAVGQSTVQESTTEDGMGELPPIVIDAQEHGMHFEPRQHRVRWLMEADGLPDISLALADSPEHTGDGSNLQALLQDLQESAECGVPVAGAVPETHLVDVSLDSGELSAASNPKWTTGLSAGEGRLCRPVGVPRLDLADVGCDSSVLSSDLDEVWNASAGHSMDSEARAPISATSPEVPVQLQEAHMLRPVVKHVLRDGVWVAFVPVEADISPLTQKEPHRLSPLDRKLWSSGGAAVWHEERPVPRAPRQTCSLEGAEACAKSRSRSASPRRTRSEESSQPRVPRDACRAEGALEFIGLAARAEVPLQNELPCRVFDGPSNAENSQAKFVGPGELHVGAEVQTAQSASLGPKTGPMTPILEGSFENLDFGTCLGQAPRRQAVITPLARSGGASEFFTCEGATRRTRRSSALESSHGGGHCTSQGVMDLGKRLAAPPTWGVDWPRAEVASVSPTRGPHQPLPSPEQLLPNAGGDEQRSGSDQRTSDVHLAVSTSEVTGLVDTQLDTLVDPANALEPCSVSKSQGSMSSAVEGAPSRTVLETQDLRSDVASFQIPAFEGQASAPVSQAQLQKETCNPVVEVPHVAACTEGSQSQGRMAQPPPCRADPPVVAHAEARTTQSFSQSSAQETLSTTRTPDLMTRSAPVSQAQFQKETCHPVVEVPHVAAFTEGSQSQGRMAQPPPCRADPPVVAHTEARTTQSFSQASVQETSSTTRSQGRMPAAPLQDVRSALGSFVAPASVASGVPPPPSATAPVHHLISSLDGHPSAQCAWMPRVALGMDAAQGAAPQLAVPPMVCPKVGFGACQSQGPMPEVSVSSSDVAQVQRGIATGGRVERTDVALQPLPARRVSGSVGAGPLPPCDSDTSQLHNPARCSGDVVSAVEHETPLPRSAGLDANVEEEFWTPMHQAGGGFDSTMSSSTGTAQRDTVAAECESEASRTTTDIAHPEGPTLLETAESTAGVSATEETGTPVQDLRTELFADGPLSRDELHPPDGSSQLLVESEPPTVEQHTISCGTMMDMESPVVEGPPVPCEAVVASEPHMADQGAQTTPDKLALVPVTRKRPLDGRDLLRAPRQEKFSLVEIGMDKLRPMRSPRQRPARKVIRPLEHWRNEQLVYERRPGSQLPTVAAIVVAKPVLPSENTLPALMPLQEGSPSGSPSTSPQSSIVATPPSRIRQSTGRSASQPKTVTVRRSDARRLSAQAPPLLNQALKEQPKKRKSPKASGRRSNSGPRNSSDSQDPVLARETPPKRSLVPVEDPVKRRRSSASAICDVGRQSVDSQPQGNVRLVRKSAGSRSSTSSNEARGRESVGARSLPLEDDVLPVGQRLSGRRGSGARSLPSEDDMLPVGQRLSGRRASGARSLHSEDDMPPLRQRLSGRRGSVSSSEGAASKHGDRRRQSAASSASDERAAVVPQSPCPDDQDYSEVSRADGSRHACKIRVGLDTQQWMCCDIQIPPESCNIPETLSPERALLISVLDAQEGTLSADVDGCIIRISKGDNFIVRPEQGYCLRNCSASVCARIKMVLLTSGCGRDSE